MRPCGINAPLTQEPPVPPRIHRSWARGGATWTQPTAQTESPVPPPKWPLRAVIADSEWSSGSHPGARFERATPCKNRLAPRARAERFGFGTMAPAPGGTYGRPMALTFTDMNFKILVIEELMYNHEVLTPKFNREEYLAEIGAAEPEHGEPSPEARAWFEQLEVPEELVGRVTELYQDGGNETHMEIHPFWSGEDDYFNVHSAADAALFPNLKSITLIYDEDASILAEFQELGVEAEWL